MTGYGEDLMRAAFRCDEGVVETLAHFRAAQAFEPRTSFILDIGGQDMKAIFIDQGQIRSIEINEACSSGCGTFIELFANTMGYPVADFASRALDSAAPCDLGTRCTVFMNSKVKQALREGANVSDISAGLAYSVIKNAMHKVLEGDRSGRFWRAYPAAGRHIPQPGRPQSAGKYHRPAGHLPGYRRTDGRVRRGPAGPRRLAATQQSPASTFTGLHNLDIVAQTQKQIIHCRGCENQCAVTRLTFPNGGKFYTGNRCEKIFTNSGKNALQRRQHAGDQVPTAV